MTRDILQFENYLEHILSKCIEVYILKSLKILQRTDSVTIYFYSTNIHFKYVVTTLVGGPLGRQGLAAGGLCSNLHTLREQAG